MAGIGSVGRPVGGVRKRAEGKERKEKKKKGWETADEKASSLANEFEDEGEGVRIAQKVGAKFTEWLDGQFQKQCIVQKAPNYQEKREKRDNHACKDRKKARENLEVWCKQIAGAYGKVLGESFVNNDLRRKVEPWKTLFVTLEESLKSLKTLRDEAFEAGEISGTEQTFADRQFPDSLFKDFANEMLVDEFQPAAELLEISPVTLMQGMFRGGRRYGKDNTVWECECARAVTELTQALEAHYPEEASQNAGDRLESAILAKGREYARDAQQRLMKALEKAKAAEKDWQEKNTASVRGVREICGRLAAIEHILGRK